MYSSKVGMLVSCCYLSSLLSHRQTNFLRIRFSASYLLLSVSFIFILIILMKIFLFLFSFIPFCFILRIQSIFIFSFVLNIPRNRNYRAIFIVPAASFLLGDMTTIFELLEAPLRIFQGLGLSPFQAFVVIEAAKKSKSRRFRGGE